MTNVNDGQEAGRSQTGTPVSSDSNPHYVLLRRLRPILDGASQFLNQLHWKHQQFILVDNAPRHDSELDAVTMESIHRLNRSNRSDAIFRGQRELLHSLTALEPLLASIRGVFRGEEKTLIEDRFERHVQEARRLAESLKNLPSIEGDPNQPYAIRQHGMADLVLSVSELSGQLTFLRRELKELGLPEGPQSILFEQEGRLYRLNAQFKKWRDNPSQKLAGKIVNSAETFKQIKIALGDLAHASHQECLRQGMRFIGRGGEIISE
jgi:hypothetical protein